ncbi:MAG: DUF3108 domain-containing protein, partial [Giesbergeria sp.]
MIPRRALLLLTAAVLGLHALALGLAAHSGLPVVVSPAPVVFHTRTVAPLAPAVGAAVAAPPAVAPAAAKPRPAAQRKPRPAKAPAPVPEPRPSDPPPEVEVAMAPTPPASAPEDSASQPLPQAVAD